MSNQIDKDDLTNLALTGYILYSLKNDPEGMFFVAITTVIILVSLLLLTFSKTLFFVLLAVAGIICFVLYKKYQKKLKEAKENVDNLFKLK